LAATTGYEPA